MGEHLTSSADCGDRHTAGGTVWVTRPAGAPALRLAQMGLAVLPLDEDESTDRYLLSQRLAVDRRTAATLLSGIADKTLFTDAIYLHDAFQIPILILEGQVDYRYTGFHPQAVRGAITAGSVGRSV